jgi:hypothetical protein
MLRFLMISSGGNRLQQGGNRLQQKQQHETENWITYAPLVSIQQNNISPNDGGKLDGCLQKARILVWFKSLPPKKEWHFGLTDGSLANNGKGSFC